MVTIGASDACAAPRSGMATVKQISASMPSTAEPITPIKTPRGTAFCESTASSVRSAESSNPTIV